MNEIKMCPFRKTIITYHFIDHDNKDILVPLADSLYTKTHEEFTECMGEDCMAYIDTRFGGKCGLCQKW